MLSISHCHDLRLHPQALPRVRESAAQRAGPEGSQVIFRGLRVRMGIHCGIENPEDIVFEPVSGRTTYTGPAMDIARAVCDAAPGGGILLSADAFVRLPHSALAATMHIDKLINGSGIVISERCVVTLVMCDCICVCACT